MLNKVTLIGNLGADPEVRYMPQGGAVATVSLATTRRWKDKQTGERKDATEWHRVIFFNRTAEVAGDILRKVAKFMWKGGCKPCKWQDKDGHERYTTEIIAEEMHMLGSRSGGTGHFPDNQPTPADLSPAPAAPVKTNPNPSPSKMAEPPYTGTNVPPLPPEYEDFDDDIPF